MPTIQHGSGNVMVWGCMIAAVVGELHFTEGNMNSNMYCEILQQSMIPSLWKLGRRAVFQHDNDPKHTSKTTTALLKKLRVKVMDWTSISPDLNPIEQLWGILKRKVEVRKVSNIRQFHDIVMQRKKSIPVATCETPVNSMSRRVKAVPDNDGGHIKYWQLTWCRLILTTFSKRCTHFCWLGFNFWWLYFELFWRKDKLTLLYKLHTDYFTLCQSIILSVLSHEKIYLNICRNGRCVLTFVIHYIYIYIYMCVCVCVCVCVCITISTKNLYCSKLYYYKNIHWKWFWISIL